MKGILMGYPTHLPIDPVVAHPCVDAAGRWHYNARHGRRLSTRSVLMTLRGRILASLDLGCHRFVPEPVRRYGCQASGHMQRQYQRMMELCGVCSGDHATRNCGTARRAQRRCPNYSAGHQAWNRQATEDADDGSPGRITTTVRETGHGKADYIGRRRRWRRRKRTGHPEQSAPTLPSTGEMELDPPRQETVKEAATSEGPPPAVTPEIPTVKKRTRDETTTPEEKRDATAAS